MELLRRFSLRDTKLHCLIEGQPLADEMAKLYEYLCPIKDCWQLGEQEPFYEMELLKEHLAVDHNMTYCEICLGSRPVFLCEQVVYGNEALKLHLEGKCATDSSSFTGHPPCHFCRRKGKRFYDGEALLKHMQAEHYSCDVCNREQFTFTFFENRTKLDQHFRQAHKICVHPDCASLDTMVRVFADEFELTLHRKNVHGMKSKVVFSPETFCMTSDPATWTSGSGSSPATSASANVIQITFDHVFRKEKVEMLPTTSSGHCGPRHRSTKQAVVLAPKGKGIPSYYHKQDVMSAMVQTRAAMHVDPSSPTSDTPTTFSLGESMQVYTARNNIPNDPREQQKCLNELLTRLLTSPVMYARFKQYSKDFADGILLTGAYYDRLVNEIFTEQESFNEVYPLLVATVPNPSKKRALQEVWKMKMAPELHRQNKARREEAKEKAVREAATEADSEWDMFRYGDHHKKCGNNKKGSNNCSKTKATPNAWLTPASAKLKRDTSGDSMMLPAREMATPQPVTASHESVGGWDVSPSSPLVTVAARLDDRYPALPANSFPRVPGLKKKQSGRPNAWFS